MFTFDCLCIVINGLQFLGGKWRDNINREKTYWNIFKGCIEDYKGKYIYIKV